MTEATVTRPRVLTNDEVAERIGELEDQFVYHSATAALYAQVIKAKAAAAAAAGKAGAFARTALQATKVSLAAGAAGNLARATTARVTAAAAKVRTAIDVPALVGLLVFSQDARETAARVLVPGARFLGHAVRVALTPVRMLDSAIDKGLRKVGLGRLADLRNRNGARIKAVAVRVVRYVALQAVRGLLFLNAHENNSGFRWARWFFQYRAYSAFAKALVPAQYRTMAYIAYLVWNGRKAAPAGTAAPFVSDRGWAVEPVSVVKNGAAPVVNDAEVATTGDGQKVLAMNDSFFTMDEVEQAGWRIVPRGAVQFFVDGKVVTDSTEAFDVEQEQLARIESKVERIEVARKAAAPRKTSPRKGRPTPAQQKKRPAKPPVARKAPAPASA